MVQFLAAVLGDSGEGHPLLGSAGCLGSEDLVGRSVVFHSEVLSMVFRADFGGFRWNCPSDWMLPV